MLPPPTDAAARILVIKLGAFGDFIHALPAFAAIRAHHAGQPLALLTTAPYAALGRAAPWFDEVLVDERAPWWNLPAIRRTVRLLRGFDFVYDLQTSGRSNRYFRLAGRPGWSGIAAGCSHPHRNPARDTLHTVERQRDQLRFAGITHWPVPDRSWLAAHGGRHGIAAPYALLMPGGAGHGSAKRWPAARYGRLASFLRDSLLPPVVIGSAADQGLADAIRIVCPEAIDLTGRTSIPDIAALGEGATLVVGNDTGPVHLAAAVGAPTIALFSAVGIPAQAAPRGPRGEWATVLQSPDLDDLAVETVIAAAAAELRKRDPAGARPASVG